MSKKLWIGLLSKVLGILLCGSLVENAKAQTIVFEENFSNYPNQTTQSPGLWTTVAGEYDDPGINSGTNYWGTYNGRFRCNDIEGTNQDEQNFLTTVFFDISSFSKIALYGDYEHNSASECSTSPYANDVIRFEYTLDGGANWIEYGYICGDDDVPGTISSTCMDGGDSIAIRVQMANKANDENAYIDNLKIIGYNAPPVEFPNDTTFCGSAGVFLQATNGQNYQWQGGDSLSCSTCSSVFVYVDSSDTVYVTAEDSAGCITSDTIAVTLYEGELDFGNDTVLCPGEVLTLTAQQPYVNSYLWSTNGTSHSITINSPGTYWAAVDLVCGFVTDTIVVDYDVAPVSNLSGDTVICDSNWIITLDAGIGSNYYWNTVETTRYIDISTEGDYWVEISTGCGTISDTINVSYSLPPVVQLIPDTTLCEGEFLQIDATPVNAYGGENYQWNDGSSTSAVEISSGGSYVVTVTNACGAMSDTVNVVYQTLPVLQINDTLIYCSNAPFVMDAKNNGATYYWSTGDTTQELVISTSGYYSVEVTGCDITLYEDFEVTYQHDFSSVEFPNVFTPNGDGVNDGYGLGDDAVGYEFQSFELVIFDRWGTEVFNASTPYFLWDGKDNGRELNEGTYFMVMSYEDTCSSGEQTKKETITLLR
ncbi:MAG: hypothetical protein CL843_03980 [Crocinitomicaceae bacterium]|nr:hypothetical protein [Crocinitomicaceae bacterium]|tara:strand:+ start:1190 stop:3136 length:1947 start_codon:yes stop_codon:yes gene_type:complete